MLLLRAIADLESYNAALLDVTNGMRRQDFSFELPQHLIAAYPPEVRSDCRLLQLDGMSGHRVDRQFRDIKRLLNAGDLLVFNDTKVIPARMHGRKPTGGRVEVLLERLQPGGEFLAQVGSSKALKIGSKVQILPRKPHEAPHAVSGELEVLGREGSFYRLKITGGQTMDDLFGQAGHMPLPPYLNRADNDTDVERYQTVYAQNPGAVAAPTAGLHFDQSLLDELEHSGVRFAYVTLHVGAATFQPVRADALVDHTMHAEHIQVSQQLCDQVVATWGRGGKVVAVGSTSVRALESASQSGQLNAFDNDSRLFIYPGYQFHCVDAMITNFHLSESSLLMMVSAFSGRQHVLAAYQHAIDEQYKFFSYGDAMYLSPSQPPLLREQFL